MGQRHPDLKVLVNNDANCLGKMGRTQKQITAALHELAPEIFSDDSSRLTELFTN
jgi:hypothetical protein